MRLLEAIWNWMMEKTSRPWLTPYDEYARAKAAYMQLSRSHELRALPDFLDHEAMAWGRYVHALDQHLAHEDTEFQAAADGSD